MVRRVALGTLLPLLSLCLVSCGSGGEESAPLTTPSASDQKLYLNPTSALASVADDDARFAELAAQPTPMWLTEWAETDKVAGIVARYVTAADKAGQAPVLVIYRVPERDCGRSQEGALSEPDYRKWTAQIAAGITDAANAGAPAPWLLLEPDAISMSDECGGDKRLALLKETTAQLSATGAQVYLDAGHSEWHSAGDQAERLVAAGIDQARGFATNVANQKPVDQERRYAAAILAELEADGVSDKHYVVDTSRAGAVVKGSACNSFDARLGPEPQIVTDPTLDAYLWVKTPGFPDGLCNGAPNYDFWPKLALSLMGAEE